MSNQKPTVGRIVHFLPPFTGSDQPCPGLVVGVNQTTGRANLVYWDIAGKQHVVYDAEQSETIETDRWCWPPRV
ncbi:MAG TPA: hypothetical protein VLN57_21210 [Xanthobacteraceae bacterium]|nr:hypothetical protein [Xanthobacteraceae bacterium]